MKVTVIYMLKVQYMVECVVVLVVGEAVKPRNTLMSS